MLQYYDVIRTFPHMLGFCWMSVHNSVLAFLTMVVKCYESMADCQTLRTRSKVDTATGKHHIFPCTYVFPCILGLSHYTLLVVYCQSKAV